MGSAENKTSLIVAVIAAIFSAGSAWYVTYHSGKVQQRIAAQDRAIDQSTSAQANLVQEKIAQLTNVTQQDIASMAVQHQYVALAVNILREEPTPASEPLREFALSILEKTSPFPLDDALKAALRSKSLKVPPAGGFGAGFSTSFGGGAFSRSSQPRGVQPDGAQPPGVE